MAWVMMHSIYLMLKCKSSSLEVFKNWIKNKKCSWNFQRIPWNYRTQFGYLIALLLEVITAFSVAFTLSMIMCFLSGFCCFVISFVVDITHDLSHSNISDETPTNGDKTVLKERLCKVVQLHSDIKQLSGRNSIKN